MRELSLIAAIVAALAAAIVLAQDERPAAQPLAADSPAGAPVSRANPFSPLNSVAAPAPWSALTPPLETGSPPGDAVPQTAAPASVRLHGILYCESKPLVVINDRIAGVGDEVAGMRVKAIARDKVTLAGPRGVWVMTPLQPEARPAPAVPPAPAETGKPAVKSEAASSSEEETPEAPDAEPALVAEMADQPLGKESP